MPLRPWAGIQTVTATAQPVFGTVLSAAGDMQVDQYTGNTKPGSNPSITTLPVASTLGWYKGDRVLVGPRQGPYDAASIFKVDAPNNAIVVQGLMRAHADGELLLLNEDVGMVKIVPVVGNANVLYVGNAYTLNNAGTDPSTLDMVAPPAAAGQPTYVFESGSAGSGGIKTSEIWIVGTAPDKFLARFIQT